MPDSDTHPFGTSCNPESPTPKVVSARIEPFEGTSLESYQIQESQGNLNKSRPSGPSRANLYPDLDSERGNFELFCLIYSQAQNSRKALCSMVFGPQSLKI